MDNSMIIILIFAVAAVVAIGTVIWFYALKKRSRELQSQFGPEYERLVDQNGNRREAESELYKRQKRVEKLEIHPLSKQQSEAFRQRWNQIQLRFVDEPQDAVATADILLIELMNAKGYPMANFEQRAADISVDHPVVVDNYRLAHDIALRERRGESDTEELRKAVVYFRTLFEELLQEHAPLAKSATR